jgi:serine/threonine-protein kinase
MAGDPRVLGLLEEMLDSGKTPEEVCLDCPELLPEVRRRWQAFCRLDAEVRALLPGLQSTPVGGAAAPVPPTALPQVPGYEVEAVLGRGGMGVVFRARHLRLNRTVALKMTLDGAYAGPRERDRFQREAEAVARLRHPNVVQVYDVGDADGRPYFTMELVDGGSLARKLAGAPQPPREAAQSVATLAGAVHAAHAGGIVHRDLKPSNILLTPDGTPKISDFGLARRLDGGAGLTRTGVAVGTPSYMAPEQARGRPGAVGPAVDVYALGAILYELLTGRPPFRGETAAETVHQVISQEPVPPVLLNPKVPRDLETICLKCLHKDPQRRYGSAATLGEDLTRFLRGEPILARRAGPVERLVKWTRRHRSLAASIVAGILLVNVLVGVGGWVFFERTALRRAVNEDFDQVVVAQREKQWDQARTALERAKARLGGGGPRELRHRADRFERELALVERLEEIRVSHLEPYSNAARTARTSASFETAFRESGLLDGIDDPQVVAERVRATGIAPVLLAALDEWAWVDAGRRNWLLDVARRVEPHPESRRMRESGNWNSRPALEEFTRTVAVEDQSVPFLLILGRNLHQMEGDATAYLKRVQRAHPKDFEANCFLADYLHNRRRNPAESIQYYQAAIAIRPNVTYVRHNFGIALGTVGRREDALVELQVAVRLQPEAGHNHHSVGLVLCDLRRFDEGVDALRRACELEPGNATFRSNLGFCLTGKGRHAEAIEHQRQAIALDARCWQAHAYLRAILLGRGRWEPARAAWREMLALDPPGHNWWDGYAEYCLYLKDEAEYRRARTELLERFGQATDPQVAERTGRACLFLPAAEDELKQATALIDHALAADPAKYGAIMPYFRFAKALAEYRAGRMKNALDLLQGDTLRVLPPAPWLVLAMAQHRLGQTAAAHKTYDAAIASYDWEAAKATNREAWICHLLRREAEAVLAAKP